MAEGKHEAVYLVMPVEVSVANFPMAVLHRVRRVKCSGRRWCARMEGRLTPDVKLLVGDSHQREVVGLDVSQPDLKI
jgi:hypothetical protein